MAELESEADKFLANCKHRVRGSMFQAHTEAKLAGCKTFLLSSSPDFLVSRIAKMFSFEGSAGTHYGVDKEGRLCEIHLLITGPKKKEIAKLWVENPNDVIAYSDSIEDVALLEWVAHPIAVQPCRKLKKLALRLHWIIL